MYETFHALAQGKTDYILEVVYTNPYTIGPAMTVMASAEAVYITKEQAMKFFNLVEAV